MRRSNRITSTVAFSLIVALAAILQSPSICRADSVGIIVPAYFYPGTGGPGGVGDGWAAMTTAAASVPITAVLNPDSGPRPGPADPNYVNALTNLENAGGKTVAYVFTDFGATPLATVESQMSTYITQYGSLIEGFYLDGMSVTPSTLSYYQSLDTYVKGHSSTDAVIGNPGQPFLNGVTPADYLTAADTFDIFEGSNSSFSSYPNGQSWFESEPSGDFDNTIYDVPTTADMLTDISAAEGLNAGYVYVTDGGLPNPYSQLPSYWDQEVAALTPSASVPLPDTLAGSLVLCVLVAGIVRWRGSSVPSL